MSCINPIFDPEQCWICLSTKLEKNEDLMKMGCTCNRMCHKSCAHEWYTKNIRMRDSVQICETCLNPLNCIFAEHTMIKMPEDIGYDYSCEVFACFRGIGICLSYVMAISTTFVCVKVFAFH